MIKHTFLAAVSAAALLGSAAANATVSITINGVAAAAGNGLTSVYAGTSGFVTENFNLTAINGLPAGYGILGSNSGKVVTGSLNNVYAAPSAGASSAATFNDSQYLTVPTGSSSGSLTITAPLLSNYFGMYWGSVDTYNSIAFFRNDAKVGEVFGAQVIALPSPALNQGDRNQAVYVNFFLNSGVYDRIVLTSTNFAFESDNHVFGVVPVPGSALLMLSGLLGAVYLGRRRKVVAA